MLTRESIFGNPTAALKPLEVAEWGGTVFIKAMTAGEFKTWQESAKDLSGEQVAASLIIAAVTDESGNPLFTAADIPALLKMPNVVIQHVYFAVEERNIISREDARKNSQTRSPA